MKLIFFELNEVPWGVLDWFCRENPLSTLATIMPKCRQDCGRQDLLITMENMADGPSRR